MERATPNSPGIRDDQLLRLKQYHVAEVGEPVSSPAGQNQSPPQTAI
jgi:hypothetical protein